MECIWRVELRMTERTVITHGEASATKLVDGARSLESGQYLTIS